MEMIGVVDRNKLSNIDALGDELDCLVSDDRFVHIPVKLNTYSGSR